MNLDEVIGLSRASLDSAVTRAEEFLFERYGCYGTEFDEGDVPEQFRHLISFAKFFGIADDEVVREDLVKCFPVEFINEAVQLIDPVRYEIELWLGSDGSWTEAKTAFYGLVYAFRTQLTVAFRIHRDLDDSPVTVRELIERIDQAVQRNTNVFE
jgi:hypothetical protein